MKGFNTLFKHPIVLASIGIAALIAVGSGIYYVVESKTPSASSVVSTTASSSSVIANGTVEPAQNPDLAFASGGRVARVSVAVGAKVSQGQTLASLDIAALGAQRAQAVANLKSQQAKLDEMKAGPRQVDVSVKQTAVSQAQLSLSNSYQNVSSSLNDAYGKSYDALHSGTDSLFNNSDTSNPTLRFTTSNSQTAISLTNMRASLNSDINTWKSQLASISTNSSTGDLENAISTSLSHLIVLRDYTDTTLQALNSAVASSNFSQASITASLSSVGTMRTTINGLITSLQASQQQIASQKLAVQSAQDSLNQTLAGSASQDVEAQQAQVDAASASVANVDAQISNAVITAPFSGTVASVRVKQGDIVAPNTAAISLNPESALQIVVYLSEIEVTKVKAGTQAQVTLDAYGSSRAFDAQVVSVDTSPSPTNGTGSVTGYKVTLQFLATDPAVSSGMTANVTIPAAQ